MRDLCVSPPHSPLSEPPPGGLESLGGGCVCPRPGRWEGGGVVAGRGVDAGGRCQGVRYEGRQVGVAAVVVGVTQGVVVGALAVGLGGGGSVLPGVDWLPLVLQSDTPPGCVVSPPGASHH